jgi:hypothetical protein
MIEVCDRIRRQSLGDDLPIADPDNFLARRKRLHVRFDLPGMRPDW